jgi:hypothetical protein
MVFGAAILYGIGKCRFPFPKEVSMTLNIGLQPLLALVAGIAILVRPRLLSYIVAIYLIVVGALGLLNV